VFTSSSEQIVNDHVEPPAAFGYAQRARCPGCGEPVGRSREAMHSEPRAEALSSEEHGKFLSGYDAKRVFFSYRRCASCALLYCPTYYSPAQLERLYGHQLENMAEVPLSARVRTQQRYVEMVAPETAPDGDYLELGADIGIFARLCSERRRFGRYVLYEPNSEVREEIADRLQGLEYRLVAQNFAPTDMRPDSVSLAVVVHVLDHVWEPAQMLRGLYQVVRPGGRVFIVTHDENSMLARVLGRRWPPYTLQHPQLFSAASLRQIAESCGFEVVRTVKTVNYFPLLFLLGAALKVLQISDRFMSRSTAPQIGLRLGNIALLATKPDEGRSSGGGRGDG